MHKPPSLADPPALWRTKKMSHSVWEEHVASAVAASWHHVFLRGMHGLTKRGSETESVTSRTSDLGYCAEN